MAGQRAVDIEIPELRALVRDLRATPERFDKELRGSFREIARAVRDLARQKAEARTSPRPGHLAVRSITSGADSRGPFVRIGNARAPHALGHEFGSQRFKQFPDWSGSSDNAGHFFWPAIRESRDTTEKFVLEAIDTTFAKAFPSR